MNSLPITAALVSALMAPAPLGAAGHVGAGMTAHAQFAAASAEPTVLGAGSPVVPMAGAAGGNPALAAHPQRAPYRGKPGAMAKKYLGTPKSGHAWHSGAWTGEWMSAKNATKWGTWRGRPSDATPTFGERATWKDMRDSDWHIQTYRGFDGTLVYGLPLLPERAKPSQLKDVAAGKHDDTFRHVARDLKTHYKGGPVVVRIGWEANGTWMSFSATRSTAKDYRDAFRRAATVMKKEHPNIVIDFDINCGTPLRGQKHRLDSLTQLYPGDDVVDLIGCDTYDWDVLKATNDRQWKAALTPRNSVGIQDVADFARSRHKGLSFPEWGLTHAYDGNGDNPYYIRKMYEFFKANSDVLVLENYFNVSDQHMKNSIWDVKKQNPKAGAEYKRLFGRR